MQTVLSIDKVNCEMLILHWHSYAVLPGEYDSNAVALPPCGNLVGPVQPVPLFGITAMIDEEAFGKLDLIRSTGGDLLRELPSS